MKKEAAFEVDSLDSVIPVQVLHNREQLLAQT